MESLFFGGGVPHKANNIQFSQFRTHASIKVSFETSTCKLISSKNTMGL